MRQFADELGLGAFIAREIWVSAAEWDRLHAEIKQPFSPACWWRQLLLAPCRLLGCARAADGLPTACADPQRDWHKEPCVSRCRSRVSLVGCREPGLF
jgi:hypothetical protein